MIFVVLGTQKFQFNRLLKKIDELIETGVVSESVFAQIGHSDYQPQHYTFTDFLQRDQFEKRISECSVLITHSGVGTIVAGMNKQKPIIVFPRLAKYGEHVDDHQLEIADSFAKQNFVLRCGESDDLGKLIEQSHSYEFARYVSKRKKMVEMVRRYLDSI